MLHQTRYAALATILLASICLGGCWENKAKVELKVEVKTNQGDPISGAKVYLDDNEIGESTYLGSFQTSLELPVNTSPRLEVKKDSQQYYFAPFIDTLNVTAAEAQSHSFSAVLYFVPKPTPDQNGEIHEDQTLATDNKTSDASLNPKDDTQTKETAPAIAKVDTAQKPDDTLATDKAVLQGPPDIAQQNPDQTAGTSTLDLAQDQAKSPDTPAEESAPEPEKEVLFTVLVQSDKQKLEGVEVLIGRTSSADLSSICTTNARGRCALRLKDVEHGLTTLVLRKDGYKTVTHKVKLKDKGILQAELKKGFSIDVLAVSKIYNQNQGINNATVTINGRVVGKTDQFGHLSYVYAGKKDDLIAISIKTSGYLPEVYETDFTANGPMRLTKYFAPQQPPSVKTVVLKTKIAGASSNEHLQAFRKTFDRNLMRATKTHLFATTAFSEVSLSIFDKIASKHHKTVSDLQQYGWENTPLKSVADVMVVPTFIFNAGTDDKKDDGVLELSVVNSSGQILAAAKEGINNFKSHQSIDRTLDLIAQKLMRSFSFEGAILKKSGDQVTTNLGYASGRGLKPGDKLDVFGMQSSELGNAQTYMKIAQLTVKEINDDHSLCSISNLVPRALINHGDLVSIQKRQAPQIKNHAISVQEIVHNGQSRPLTQANIYLNDEWLGATDAQGKLFTDFSGSGVIKVIKHGFKPEDQRFSLAEGDASKNFNFKLKRQIASIRIDSKPSNANIFIEGKLIGKTPIHSPASIPTGFVKLMVKAPSGYKDYEAVIEVDEGMLDLTGNRQIVLDEDHLTAAQRLIDTKDITSAVELLKRVTSDQSDYLFAQHLLGEVYLDHLNKPDMAEKYFSTVTADQATKSFTDKRFIGSHISHALAIYRQAEKEQNPQMAAQKYQSAYDILQATEPQLRFIPKEQFAEAVHNLSFHKALCLQKLWEHTKDIAALHEAVESWKSYLDGGDSKIDAQGVGQRYLKNAAVYYKKAQASLETHVR